MKTEELQLGQKIIVVRYGIDVEKNCILLHQKIIESKGYCWFGKLGGPLAKKSYGPALEEANPAIILFNRKAAYLCSFLDIKFDKPEEGIPEYYYHAFFKQGIFPKCYFKLGSITELPLENVADFYVVSNGKDALTTLSHSRSPLLNVTFGEPNNNENVRIHVKKTKAKKVIQQKETTTMLSINDCFYRENGVCRLRSCINYGYDCDRPSLCAKQKR